MGLDCGKCVNVSSARSVNVFRACLQTVRMRQTSDFVFYVTDKRQSEVTACEGTSCYQNTWGPTF